MNRLRCSLWPALAALVISFACSGQEPGGPGAPGDRARAITVNVAMEARDADLAISSIRTLTARYGGYVYSGSSVQHERGYFDLRIPARNLDAFRAELRRAGTVRSESEQVEDAGEQVSDLAARIRSAQREEERLLALDARAESIADLVTLETRLGTVRERIEQLQGEQSRVAERVEYAHVSISVGLETAPYWEQPLASIGSAFRFGVTAISALAVGGASVLAAVAPALSILFLLIALLWIVARTRRARAV